VTNLLLLFQRKKFCNLNNFNYKVLTSSFLDGSRWLSAALGQWWEMWDFRAHFSAHVLLIG